MEPVIHLKDVSMVYGGNGTRATAWPGSPRYTAGGVRRHHGRVGGGEKHVADDPRGLQVPTEGAVRIGGAISPRFRRTAWRISGGRLGFVFQAYHLLRPDGAGKRDGAHVAGAEPPREKARWPTPCSPRWGWQEKRTDSPRNCRAGEPAGGDRTGAGP